MGGHGMGGLRERKKRQTQRTLWHTAMAMFIERGFDNVSVTEIAAAADVSKMTLFNYFPTKEDLVIHPFYDHVGEPAATVRNREPGESAVRALRRRFLAALAAFDAATGLNDDVSVLNVARLIRATPALVMRVSLIQQRITELLAEELAAQSGGDGLTARMAAASILAVQSELVSENSRRLTGGETAAAVLPDALAAAEHGFDLLEGGLGDYCAK